MRNVVSLKITIITTIIHKIIHKISYSYNNNFGHLNNMQNRAMSGFKP